MNKTILRLSLLAQLIFFLNACMAGKKKQLQDIGNEGIEQNLAPLGDDLMVLPENIWSPGQRRNLATFYFITAEQLAMSGQVAGAFPLYEAAYNLDPNGFLGGKMVAAKASTGDLKMAMKEANKMALLYPKDANIHFLFGKILAIQGNLKEAELQFQDTIRNDEFHEGAYMALIEALLGEEKYKEAEKIAIKMSEKLPWAVNSWVQLTRVYLLSKQKEKALASSNRAYKLHDDRPELILLRAITLEYNNRSKEAIPLFETLYKQNPNDEQLFLGIVDLYRKIGNLDEALELIDSMQHEVSDKNNSAILLQKTILMWELGKFNESLELVNKLVEVNPESDRFRYMQGWALEHLEKNDEAFKAYGHIKQDSNLNFHARTRQAYILKKLKRFDEAIKLAEQLMSEKNDEWQMIVFLASVHADQKNFKEAIQVVEDGFKKFPQITRLLFLKGVYLELTGEWKACVKTMEDVIELDPENASALNYLGFLYAEKGVELDEAEKLIGRALELKPNDGFYIDSLGWVYFQKKDYTKALETLLRALELAPDEGVIMEHVADTYLAIGDKNNAYDFYRKAAVSRLEDRDKDRLYEKLRKYGLEIPEVKGDNSF